MSAFTDLLNRKKSSLVDQWFNVAVSTYPEESARFLKRKKDQFHNPIGFNLAQQTETLFDLLVSGVDQEQAAKSLDQIVRLRAIQDFSPSEALGFILAIKPVVRNELGKEIAQAGLQKDLEAFEFEVDRMMLLAFDLFMACRERIYEIKANEVKSLYYQIIRRADVLCPIPQQLEPDLAPDK